MIQRSYKYINDSLVENNKWKNSKAAQRVTTHNMQIGAKHKHSWATSIIKSLFSSELEISARGFELLL